MALVKGKVFAAARGAAFAKSLRFLSPAQVQEAAPAVFGHQADYMSERYKQVKTSTVMEGLMDRGYKVIDAKQDRPRSEDPLTVRHMLRLVHSKALVDLDFNEGVPMLLLTNSHDGRALLRFSVGFYRFVCSNGMIAAVEDQGFRFRHHAKPLELLDEALEQLLDRSDFTLKNMKSWVRLPLSEAQVLKFARRAAVLRFGEMEGRGYDPAAVLVPRRPEDAPNDLWHVMNRVQENLMLGGLPGKASSGRKVKSRAVRGITLDVGFNKGLWSLAEEFAQAA